MSKTDQCPSSKKAGKPASPARPSRVTSTATGRTMWRSAEDLADTTEFREFLEREFPAHASELLEPSRRDFLKLMGASLAIAGAATMPACRRPDHKIITYREKPEEIIPGEALYYATARHSPGGGAEGLLAETFSGRPTKLEGNPLHPRSRGKLTQQAQASIFDLYDPDRTPEVILDRSVDRLMKGGMGRSRAQEAARGLSQWSQFETFAREHFPANYDDSQGQGLVFLANKITSPARELLKRRIQQRWPSALWLTYDPADASNETVAAQTVFGRALKPEYRLNSNDVIVSFDRDFLHRDGNLTLMREFAQRRLIEGAEEGSVAANAKMSRLYVVESEFTNTGAQADHRLPLRQGDIARAMLALARAVLDHERVRDAVRARGVPGAATMEQLRSTVEAMARRFPIEAADERLDHAAFVEAAADDLVLNATRSCVMVGPSQPAVMHALGFVINAALGNLGISLQLMPTSEDITRPSDASLVTLARLLDAGRVSTLVTVDTNPAYDAPADLEMADKLVRFGETNTLVSIGEYNETLALAQWRMGKAHFLESWHDVVDWDGAHSVIQPMIRPLFDEYRSDLELLSMVVGDDRPDGYELVRASVRDAAANAPGRRGALSDAEFETIWRRTLHDGVRPNSPGSVRPVTPQPRPEAVAAELNRSVEAAVAVGPGVDLVFRPDALLRAGEHANNGWLQEAQDPITKVCWQNPALMNERTAKKLRLRTSRHLVEPQYTHTQVISIVVGEGEATREVQVPIWIQPGMADDTIALTLGYGRSVSGRIGEGTGANAYLVRTTEAMWRASDVKVTRAPGRGPELVPCTQDHWTMKGRDSVVRDIDLPAFQMHGDLAALEGKEKYKALHDFYKNERTAGFAGSTSMTFAARLGTEAHTPANQESYTPEQSHNYYELERNEAGDPITDKKGRFVPAKDEQGRLIGLRNKYGKRVQQWGMSIDLTKCISCGACTVACQAENNIPIVGPVEVAKGREMQWIRIDRYYASDGTSTPEALDDPNPDVLSMPVACIHCENAPCEVVCPVNATVHGAEGTNNMAYNRCIGTRYCSNNCPYKVRRFNFFDYATKQFRGSMGQLGAPLEGVQEATPDALKPASEYFIPPRLREKTMEIATMRHNPHVTVRSRGVMEKCTYCIQRINSAKVETKLKDLPIVPDGYMETACQQACPTDAIVFGDIYDYESNEGRGSKVYQERTSERSYGLLAYLNTRPRTTYKLRVRNPNPRLVDAARRARWDDPFHHDGEHGHEGTGVGHGELHSGASVDSASEVKSRGSLVGLPILNGSAAAEVLPA